MRADWVRVSELMRVVWVNLDPDTVYSVTVDGGGWESDAFLRNADLKFLFIW